MSAPYTVLEIAERLSARQEIVYSGEMRQFDYAVNSHADPLCGRASLVLAMFMERCPEALAEIDADLAQRKAADELRDAAYRRGMANAWAGYTGQGRAPSSAKPAPGEGSRDDP
jgi:hypothetical protein